MNILKMIPFLSSEEVDKLLSDISIGKETGITLAQILPFASSKTIDRLMMEEFQKEGKLQTKYYPFASSRGLHTIVMYHIENDFGDLSSSILPFLNQEDIKLLFEYTLKKKGAGESKEDKGEERNIHYDHDYDDDDDDDDDYDDYDDDDDDDDDDFEDDDDD